MSTLPLSQQKQRHRSPGHCVFSVLFGSFLMALPFNPAAGLTLTLSNGSKYEVGSIEGVRALLQGDLNEILKGGAAAAIDEVDTQPVVQLTRRLELLNEQDLFQFAQTIHVSESDRILAEAQQLPVQSVKPRDQVDGLGTDDDPYDSLRLRTILTDNIKALREYTPKDILLIILEDSARYTVLDLLQALHAVYLDRHIVADGSIQDQNARFIRKLVAIIHVIGRYYQSLNGEPDNINNWHESSNIQTAMTNLTTSLKVSGDDPQIITGVLDLGWNVVNHIRTSLVNNPQFRDDSTAKAINNIGSLLFDINPNRNSEALVADRDYVLRATIGTTHVVMAEGLWINGDNIDYFDNLAAQGKSLTSWNIQIVLNQMLQIPYHLLLRHQSEAIQVINTINRQFNLEQIYGVPLPTYLSSSEIINWVVTISSKILQFASLESLRKQFFNALYGFVLHAAGPTDHRRGEAPSQISRFDVTVLEDVRAVLLAGGSIAEKEERERAERERVEQGEGIQALSLESGASASEAQPAGYLDQRHLDFLENRFDVYKRVLVNTYQKEAEENAKDEEPEH